MHDVAGKAYIRVLGDPQFPWSEDDVPQFLRELERSRDEYLARKGSTARRTGWEVTVDLKARPQIISAMLTYELVE